MRSASVYMGAQAREVPACESKPWRKPQQMSDFQPITSATPCLVIYTSNLQRKPLHNISDTACARVESHGCGFVPFSVETYGG
jgi:hypothetical protein